jgi:hypothetical protein
MDVLNDRRLERICLQVTLTFRSLHAATIAGNYHNSPTPIRLSLSMAKVEKVCSN